MDRRKVFWGSVLCLGLVTTGVGLAQDGLWARHPNLAAAEHFTHQADGALLAAQQANHWDLHGHAQHAEELLRQADREIWAAARDADRH